MASLEDLEKTLTHICQSFWRSNVSIEIDPDWGEDDSLLILNYGDVVAWISDSGNYIVDTTKDTSDPSVGIFGDFEPNSFHGMNPQLVTKSDIDAACKMFLIFMTKRVEDWAESTMEDREEM